MSKVPYTINVDSYICSELERMRTMKETLDFSLLPALIERIQFHATAMEAALERYYDIKYQLKNTVDDKEVSDADFRAKAKEALEKLKK